MEFDFHDDLLNNKNADLHSRMATLKDYINIGYTPNEALSMAGLKSEDLEQFPKLKQQYFPSGHDKTATKGDGGHIFDEEHDSDFLEWEKYDYFKTLGGGAEARKLTAQVFEITEDEILAIIKKYDGAIQKNQNGAVLWDGFCPESKLNNAEVRMRLNQDDFYESEATGLQIAVIGVNAVILKHRGNRKFRNTLSYADSIENGQVLSPQNMDRIPFNDGAIFNNHQELKEYIQGIPVHSSVTTKPFVSDTDLTQLLSQKRGIDKKLEETLKAKGFHHFSSKKFIGDYGEYLAKLNLKHLFVNEEILISNNSNDECDMSGTLKPEVAKEWNIVNPEVRIEVKTRYHQKGMPHLFGIKPHKFDLLVFVSLNEDYSCHFVGVLKSIDLKVDKQSRVVFSNNYKHQLLYPKGLDFIQH